MSVTEIIAELESLTPEELTLIEDKLAQLHSGEFVLTPERREAVEAGRRAYEKNGGITSKEMRQKMASWNTK